MLSMLAVDSFCVIPRSSMIFCGWLASSTLRPGIGNTAVKTAINTTRHRPLVMRLMPSMVFIPAS